MTVPTPGDESNGWKDFVLAHGFRAKGYELAHVVGRSVAEVESVRRTEACTRRTKGKGFSDLFSAWHGRSPHDSEWPVPDKIGGVGSYYWQEPELILLATLVGRFGVTEIAQILTERLQKLTGDLDARRSSVAVQVGINRIGLQTNDVLGGITTTQAAREIDSLAIVQQAIRNKQLPAVRVGRLWVIPHDEWSLWKSKRTFPPKDFVQLSTIREELSIKSDKLSEFARMGYVPTAVRCNPFGTKGRSTRFGTWFVHRDVAEQMLRDRRNGLPMPWHGKPNADNLRATFKLWQGRRHPAACAICKDIWGDMGAPADFEAYALRYPPLAHGAKRHMTRTWNPGLTLPEVAKLTNRSVTEVRTAVANGMMSVAEHGARKFVSRTNATRWLARKCPTGEADRSWISLDNAKKQYLFSLAELRGFVKSRKLHSKTGTVGAMRGIVYVSRHQCGELREKIGFSEVEAARRAGVPVARFRELLKGVNWRKTSGIPLAAVQSVIKRLESNEGYSIADAARKVGMPEEWVHEHLVKGTIRVHKTKWDLHRVYITEPMLKRLEAAKLTPDLNEQMSAEWLRLSAAATEAGVSATTVIKWAVDGELDRQDSASGWRYHRQAVRIRARAYWATVRFHRANPPRWLQDEPAWVTPVATPKREKMEKDFQYYRKLAVAHPLFPF